MHDVAWRGMWICVRSKDAQKQLARTSLSEFIKVFERKVWRVQAAHLHNPARALSSPSRCFSCQDKYSFRYLWYCGKKQIECGLAWSVLSSTTVRVITVVKMLCKCCARFALVMLQVKNKSLPVFSNNIFHIDILKTIFTLTLFEDLMLF